MKFGIARLAHDFCSEFQVQKSEQAPVSVDVGKTCVDLGDEIDWELAGKRLYL